MTPPQSRQEGTRPGRGGSGAAMNAPGFPNSDVPTIRAISPSKAARMASDGLYRVGTGNYSRRAMSCARAVSFSMTATRAAVSLSL